jgi:hypothetical protein
MKSRINLVLHASSKCYHKSSIEWSLRFQRRWICAIVGDSSQIVQGTTTLVFVLPQKLLVVLKSMKSRIILVLHASSKCYHKSSIEWSLRFQRRWICSIVSDSSQIVQGTTTLVFILPQMVLAVLRSMKSRVILVLPASSKYYQKSSIEWSLRLRRRWICAIVGDSSRVVQGTTTLVFVLPQMDFVVFRSMKSWLKLIL